MAKSLSDSSSFCTDEAETPERENNSSYQSVRGESEVAMLMTKEANLERENQQVQEEIETLKKEIQTMDKMMCASRGACKMFGHVAPGDITHDDVKRKFQNLFKQAFRNMVPKFTKEEEKYKIWQTCAEIFQICFDMQKDLVVAKMMGAMKDSLNQDFSKCKFDEDTYDLHCAFKMLLTQVNEAELKLKVKKKIPHVSDDMICFVFNVIQGLDPIHYKTFLDKGELQDDTFFM